MQKLLVTGASGFLGGRTAAHFAQLPGFAVRATSRSAQKAATLNALGCEFWAGDLTDCAFTNTLVEGIDIIVHCAALSAPFGLPEAFYSANMLATENLMQSALQAGVSKFIFISTPTIYVDLKPKHNIKESDPLPQKPVNNYAATKLDAERFVIAKNNQGIQTVALRPRAIIGAEDTVIFPRILKAYHEGKLKIVGNGTNLCDLTCARNVIEAIHCAIMAPPQAYGEAYNITNGEPVNFWDMLNYALESLGLQRIKKRVPKALAIRVATLIEAYYRRFRPNEEPTLTPYGIAVLADHFTMDISKARLQLNYQPVMSTKEGIDEFIKWHLKQ
jgi:nucleoside-diphosphate-sugar epimerase